MANNIKIAFERGRMDLYNYVKEQQAQEQAEAEARMRESELLARGNTLRSAVLAEFYEYRRIQDTYESRLLTLHPADKADIKLSGRLEPFVVGQKRRYKALSYVWGEPRFTDKIFIEGKRLAITNSLGAALRRLRPSPGQPPLQIWIDQICINQNDTIERSQQVRLMHAIFREASQVLVWLGGDAEGHASRAFQLAASLRSIFDDTLLAGLCKAQGANFDWIPAEYWRSLRELSKLPWFRRVWIPQEIGTDADATVYWGSESMGWVSLEASMRRLETQGWELRKKHKIDTTAITVLFRRFSETPSSSSAERRSFVYQLCLSARNVATDPRDYVFATLGHPSAWIESEQVMIIQPDYKNTVADVYHEIAIRALTTERTLMVLNAVSDNGEPRPPIEGGPLPTWVPRWDAGRFGSIIGFPGRYRSSGLRRSGITIITSFEDNYQTLLVKGLVIDTIEKVTPRFTSSCFSPESSKRELLQTAWRLCRGTAAAISKPGLPQQTKEKDSREKIKEKSETISKFSAQGMYQPDASRSALQAFLDTLAPVARFTTTLSASSTAVPSNDNGITCTTTYHSGIAALERLFPGSSSFSNKHDPRKLLHPPVSSANTVNSNTSSHPGTKTNATAWIQAASDHVVPRCFGVTTSKTGYFALLPPTARAGDTLVVLLGGDTPYVLRRCQPKAKAAPTASNNSSKDALGMKDGSSDNGDPMDKYQFVGEAYVHGLMDGEDDKGGLFGSGTEVRTLRLQ